jgi:hypothetical protein
MECQLRPLVYSLDLNNSPRIGLTPGKSHVKNLWRNKQGGSRCKMAGAGMAVFCQVPRSNAADSHNMNNFLANRSQTYCGMPTTARQYTAECQLLGTIWPRNATDQKVPLLNFPRNATNRATVLSPWHSAVHIWPRNLANDWIPAPAILHRQFPCLLRHKILMRDFLGVRQIRGGLFRPKLYTNGLSWQTISWYYPFNGYTKCLYCILKNPCQL